MGSRWFAGLLLLILAAVIGGGYTNPDLLEELWKRWEERWKYHVTDFPERQGERALVLHGSGLPEVNEARVFRIADDAAGSTGVRMDPPLTDMKKYIVNERLLKDEEARMLAALWRGLDRRYGFSAACHDPHHVIRFFHQGRKISEVFVCFHCGNATLPAFPEAAIVCFNGAGMTGSADYLHFQSVIEGYVGKHPERPRPARKK